MKTWFLTGTILLTCWCAGSAEESVPTQETNLLWQQVQESEFNLFIRVLPFATWRQTDSGIDDLPDFYESRYGLLLRPDLQWSSDWVQGAVKPRLEFYHEELVDGQNRDESDAFIYEWRTAVDLSRDLTVGYARENKQWGPSILLSPSNPFQAENGRNTPKEEVDSSDYAQLDWTPSSSLQMSLIANTDEGRRDYPSNSFEQVYAVKADWTGESKQAALVGSVRDGEERIGLYSLWNMNDAWMLYNEAGWQEDDTEILCGTGYTFDYGGMITVEYFYNESGEKEGDPLTQAMLLRQTSPRELLLRQNYVLLQYAQPMIMDVLDVTLRWVCNMDDESHILFAFADWGLSDRLEFFVHASLSSTDDKAEFGYLVDHAVQTGLEITF